MVGLYFVQLLFEFAMAYFKQGYLLTCTFLFLEQTKSGILTLEKSSSATVSTRAFYDG